MDDTLMIIAFAVVLVATYFATKLISGKAASVMKGKYISVIEGITLGVDKRIVLIRAGNKNLLISIVGKNIQLLTEVTLDDDIAQENSSNSSKTFMDYFNIFSKKDDNLRNLEKSDFKKNLEKLKNMNSDKDFTNDK